MKVNQINHTDLNKYVERKIGDVAKLIILQHLLFRMNKYFQISYTRKKEALIRELPFCIKD